jgi:hypothetical protein
VLLSAETLLVLQNMYGSLPAVAFYTVVFMVQSLVGAGTKELREAATLVDTALKIKTFYDYSPQFIS